MAQETERRAACHFDASRLLATALLQYCTLHDVLDFIIAFLNVVVCRFTLPDVSMDHVFSDVILSDRHLYGAIDIDAV